MIGENKMNKELDLKFIIESIRKVIIKQLCES